MMSPETKSSPIDISDDNFQRSTVTLKLWAKALAKISFLWKSLPKWHLSICILFGPLGTWMCSLTRKPSDFPTDHAYSYYFVPTWMQMQLEPIFFKICLWSNHFSTLKNPRWYHELPPSLEPTAQAIKSVTVQNKPLFFFLFSTTLLCFSSLCFTLYCNVQTIYYKNKTPESFWKTSTSLSIMFKLQA